MRYINGSGVLGAFGCMNTSNADFEKELVNDNIRQKILKYR